VVNTDQGYAQSNARSQLLTGAAGSTVPAIAAVGGVAVQPVDAGLPLAIAPVALAPGAAVVVSGQNFSTPLVNLFTSAGNLGPLTPEPGGDGGSVTIVVPAGAPTGPGALQVINAPYGGNVTSAAVSLAIGARIALDAVSVAGPTVTLDGAGFSTTTVLNLFAQSGAGLANFGGLDGGGQPRLPLTLHSPQRVSFTLPAGVQPGAAFVQAINPPYAPFSSTGDDPDGAFTVMAP
jgi:hypothetical protein